MASSAGPPSPTGAPPTRASSRCGSSLVWLEMLGAPIASRTHQPPTDPLDGFGQVKSVRRQMAWAQLLEYEHLDESTADRPATLALEVARDALKHRLLLFTMPLYNVAWGAMREGRGLLCRSADLPQLFVILEEIRADAECLACHPQQREHYDYIFCDLSEIRQELLELIPARSRGKDHSAELRAAGDRLERLNQEVSELVDRVWENVDRKRQYVIAMALGFVVPLVAAILLLQRVAETSWYFSVAVAAFGALGGFTSALLHGEGDADGSPDDYLGQELMFLRPLVGAATSLVAVAAVLGGVVSISVVDAQSSLAAFLAVSFAAGFGERVFIGRFLGGRDEHDDDGVAAANAGRTISVPDVSARDRRGTLRRGGGRRGTLEWRWRRFRSGGLSERR
jgi:hypothetical protein